MVYIITVEKERKNDAALDMKVNPRAAFSAPIDSRVHPEAE